MRADPFRDALDARTLAPFLTATAVVINLVVFALMLAGDGRISDAGTLAGWGGSAGGFATDGQWWRLVTATFVHAGVLPLLLETAALAHAGMLVERILGPVAFAAVYLTSATFGGAIAMRADPWPVAVGSSAAVMGLQGVLIAIVLRGTLRRSPVTVPMPVIGQVALPAAVFALYAWANGGPQWTAGLAAFVIQFAVGLSLAWHMAERKPAAHLVGGLAVAVLAVTTVIAAPLSGAMDVRSEIARLIAVEDRTMVSYETANERFKRGVLHRDELAQLIERVIVPELDAARLRLHTIVGVPPRQQTLVDGADDFLRLRRESWLIRASALQASDTGLLREADEADRASLTELRAVKRKL